MKFHAHSCLKCTHQAQGNAAINDEPNFGNSFLLGKARSNFFQTRHSLADHLVHHSGLDNLVSQSIIGCERGQLRFPDRPRSFHITCVDPQLRPGFLEPSHSRIRIKNWALISEFHKGDFMNNIIEFSGRSCHIIRLSHVRVYSIK